MVPCGQRAARPAGQKAGEQQNFGSTEMLIPAICDSTASPKRMRQAMRIAAYSRMPSAGALRAQLSELIAPLAALSYPFILTGFNASVTTITKSDVGVL